MFLFKRRKADSEKQAEQVDSIQPVTDKPARGSGKTSATVKTSAESKAVKPFKKTIEGQGKKLPDDHQQGDQTLEDEGVVKVVVPASALKEDSSEEEILKSDPEQETEDDKDALVDSLLEKVNQPVKGEDNTIDVSLDAVKAPAASESASGNDKTAKKSEAQGGKDSPAPTKPEAKAPAKDEKAAKSAADSKPAEEGKDSLFSSLFGKTEKEEETAIDRLVSSLPDIGIEEVMSEAEEVKELMNESYQSQGR